MSRGARIIVGGGGIGGVSVAYHLASRGARVTLLERAALGSGTTWHSTGNMETYRADPLLFGMVRYAAELYPRIARETARDIGWRVVGRVMYTDRAERLAQFESLPALGAERGITIERLECAGLEQRLPVLSAAGLLGGVWIPSDARVNPTDAVHALAHAARALGAEIRERAPVLALRQHGAHIIGVETAHGALPADAVVLAAGLWSADLARGCGVNLPLHALEHQYLITRPFGVDQRLPLFLSFDDQLYGREEVGGLIVGSLDDDAVPIESASVPEPGLGALLPERWSQFEPYLARALERFPALRSTPMRMLLNGPEAFTPDGRMLLGPVPGIAALWSACAFNSNGLALAPAAGAYLADWILDGAPAVALDALDPGRFAPEQCVPAYVREQVRYVPARACRLPTTPP